MSARAYGSTWTVPDATEVLVSVDPGPVTFVVIDGAVTWVTVSAPGRTAETSSVTGCEDKFASSTSGPP
jgi:hypothetical protein